MGVKESAAAGQIFTVEEFNAAFFQLRLEAALEAR
jgi:hypothetical protein